MENTEKPKKIKPKWYSPRGIAEIVVAIIFVLILRSSVFESFVIPSGSMIPTLQIGDRLFVNKFAYSLKVPLTEYFLQKPIEIIKRAPPKRGDIVVFVHPDPDEKGINLIKRVVGTPGDIIEVKNKVIYINNEPVTREEIKDSKVVDTVYNNIDPRFFDNRNMKLLEENLGGVKHMILETDYRTEYKDWGPKKIPEDYFFFMGDNRDYSADSRDWGFAHISLVKGQAAIIWFNLWWDFAKSQLYFFPSRIGKIINR